MTNSFFFFKKKKGSIFCYDGNVYHLLINWSKNLVSPCIIKAKVNYKNKFTRKLGLELPLVKKFEKYFISKNLTKILEYLKKVMGVLCKNIKLLWVSSWVTLNKLGEYAEYPIKFF